MSRNLLWTLLKYAVGLAILGWVVWSNWAPEGRPGLSQIDIRNLRFGYIGLAWVCVTASVSVTFVRWFILVRAQGISFSLGEAFRLGMVGHAWNTLLPGVVGGDIIKAAILARNQTRKTLVVTTVVFDRLIGAAGLFWLVCFWGMWFWLGHWSDNRWLWTIVLFGCSVAGVTLVVWLAMLSFPRGWSERLVGWLGKMPKVGGALGELWQTLDMYRLRSGSVVLALLLSMLNHSLMVSAFYFASLSISGELAAVSIPSFWEHLLMVPAGMTFQASIPTPGGVGGGEYAFGELYHQLRPGSRSQGVFMAFLHRLVNYSVSLLCYVAFLRMKPQLAKKAHPLGQENSAIDSHATNSTGAVPQTGENAKTMTPQD